MIFLLIHLWLYLDQFKGALVLTQLVINKIRSANLNDKIDLMY